MAMDEQVLEVAVIGGGLGGFAVAAGLHARGIKAHVFEKSSSLSSDTATSISLGLNATRALNSIVQGLSDKIKSRASLTKTVKFINVPPGLGPEMILVEASKSDLYVVKWRTARRILAQHVPSDHIHCSHTFLRYYESADGEVQLEFATNGGQVTQPTTVRARLVVGADGINSAVRKIMVGDEPRDLHLLNWNALVYDPERKLKVHDEDQICLIRKAPTLCFLLDAGEGYTLWVFRVEDTDSGSKTGTYTGNKTRVLNEIDKLPGTSFYTSLRKVVEATEPEMIFERRIRDRLPISTWSDLDQKVILIGDAAHAMYWGPAQGARTAFEDAHQLTELVASAFEAGGSAQELQNAVGRFEELRIPRMTKFQNYAAETTSIPDFIPESTRNLPPAEHRRRKIEFERWASSYPDKMSGDPSSTYFK